MALESQIYGETFPPGLPPLRFLRPAELSSQGSIIIGALPANMLERASTSDHARYRNNACVIPQTFVISDAILERRGSFSLFLSERERQIKFNYS